eukprot:18782-Pyramimonas_sp.AAC.1
MLDRGSLGEKGGSSAPQLGALRTRACSNARRAHENRRGSSACLETLGRRPRSEKRGGAWLGAL